MPDSKQPRIFYIRDSANFHIACVAYKTVTSNPAPAVEVSRVQYAVSVCNPIDYRVFNKKKARNTVLARLDKFRAKFTGSVEPGEKLCERILTDMLTRVFTVRDRGTDRVQHVPYPKPVLEATRRQLTQFANDATLLAEFKRQTIDTTRTEIPTMEAPPEDEHTPKKDD